MIWKQNSLYSADVPIIIVIPSSSLIKKHNFIVVGTGENEWGVENQVGLGLHMGQH